MTSFDDKRPIRVLIADDHGLIRAGLRALLQTEADIEVVGEAAGGVEARQRSLELRPDVVLADISMPAPDGIEVARLLRLQLPGCMTLILTMHEDPRMLRDALAAGAAGYLIKRSAESELATAVRVTAAGQQYIHADMRKHLAALAPQPDAPRAGESPAPALTANELALLTLLAQAATMQKCAEALGLTNADTEQMRHDVMARLGLRSRVDIVKYVQQLGGAAQPR